ncbi:MAG: ABC transporter permease [Kiritimatiellia bacterium]|jgi:ribose/xylose/arabinose/galactoside ABC-type transport system permease subunit|nr:ABC transporter permease [Kiritimatiellia bacterium]
MNRKRLDYRTFVLDRLIWFIIILVFVFFSIFAHQFLSTTNMINLLLHTSVLGLLVLGQATCLLSGNFDLSAEGTVTLLTVLAAWLMGSATAGAGANSFDSGSGWGLNPVLVIFIIMFLGAGIGWLNGQMIARLRMNNFIVTLAMQLTLRGLALTLCLGRNIASIPEVFRYLGTGKVGPIPVQVIVTLLFVAVFYYYYKVSSFGRALYATGGNPRASYASGFNPGKTVIKAYMISGFLAAIAGWMLLGGVGESGPELGVGLTLETVAAAVIGGIALSGGRGTILGAFAGVLLLSVVGNGLNVMDMHPNAVRAVRGLIILMALIIEAQKVRYKPKLVR